MPKLRPHLTILGVMALTLIALTARTQQSQELFDKKCANCHGKDGGGHVQAGSKIIVPDLRSKQIREMSDAEMTDSIANGTKHRDYPHAFLHIGLTNDQIASLVKYIRVLQVDRKPSEKK